MTSASFAIYRTPMTAYNLKAELHSESVPSNRSSSKNLSASAEKRVEPDEADEAQTDAAASYEEENERKRPILVMDLSAPPFRPCSPRTRSLENCGCEGDHSQRGARKYGHRQEPS